MTRAGRPLDPQAGLGPGAGVGRRRSWWCSTLLVVATALSTIRRDLGASIEQLEWTVNAYTLSFAVLLMTAAARSATGSAGGGCSPPGWAVRRGVGGVRAGPRRRRADRGARGAGRRARRWSMPLALALLNAAFPPQRRGWAMGIFGGVTGLAVVVGPVLGGAITQGLAWQWIFWLNVPIGLAAIPLVLRRLAESYGPRAGLDLPGLGLVTGRRARPGVGAGARQLGRLGQRRGRRDARGRRRCWPSCSLRGRLRARAPMLPMRLFAFRGFSAGNAAIFLLNASLTGAVFFIAQFLQVSLGQDPLGAGLRLLPWGVAPFLIGAPGRARWPTGSASARWSSRGLLLQAAGLAWIAVIAAPGVAYAAMLAPMFVSGAGFATGPARAHQGRGRLGPARRHRQGLGGVQHDAPARRRLRGRDPGRRVRPWPAATPPPPPSATGSRPPPRPRPAWPSPGRSPDWRCPDGRSRPSRRWPTRCWRRTLRRPVGEAARRPRLFSIVSAPHADPASTPAVFAGGIRRRRRRCGNASGNGRRRSRAGGRRRLFLAAGPGEARAARHVQVGAHPGGHPRAGGGRGRPRLFPDLVQSRTAKRLRHNDWVQAAPCAALGLYRYGPWLDATARLLAGEEASQAEEKLARQASWPARRPDLTGRPAPEDAAGALRAAALRRGRRPGGPGHHRPPTRDVAPDVAAGPAARAVPARRRLWAWARAGVSVGVARHRRRAGPGVRA